MECLNEYEEEFIKPLLLSFRYFRNCNIVFFDTNISFWQRYWRYLYQIPLFILYYSSLSMFVVKVFTEGLDPFQDAQMIPMWLVTTQVIDKSATILAWQYLLIPLTETLIRIFFLVQEAKFLLPFACIYPFEIDNWPKYLGVYVFQVYNEFILLYMYLGSYLLLVELSTYLSIQFKLLQEDLIKIEPTNNSMKTGSDNDDEITEYRDPVMCGANIEEFIRRHQEVIKLSDRINAIFNKILFFNLLFSTLIICFFAVAVKASKETAYTMTYFAIMVHITSTVFVMCYCSELLKSSSTGIAQSAAKNLWYNGDLRYQTIIYFIMLRSQKPCILTYLNYSSISMNTLNKVLKTTYSYFSLASQLYDSRD